MRKILLVTFLLLMALSVGLAAQNPGSSAPPAPTDKQTTDTKPIKVNVNVVNVLMTVTDKKNHLVLDLTKDDFRLLEDNKPQRIQYFSRESNLPLRIGILIDTSNSIRERLRFEQEAAIDFLNSTLRPGKDQAFIVGFDVQPVMVQDYTDDMEKLSNAVRGLQAGGVTSLYDAIYFACKERMLFFPPPEPYLRRVVIVVSDGQDNTSEHTREEALAMAQRAEVTMFTISTNRSGAPGRGDKVLRYLAEQTGGRAFFPFEASELAENFQEISRELRSQYSLGYVSSNTAHDGTFRNIAVEPVEKGLHVRAKSGYFALSP
ncbi:MAG: VWA domain-containing protein [Acidobacteriia bacterium]|nr:VWA domain-containing protein [Terriglobia bacterium]